jgi:hypothetical protein
LPGEHEVVLGRVEGLAALGADFVRSREARPVNDRGTARALGAVRIYDDVFPANPALHSRRLHELLPFIEWRGHGTFAHYHSASGQFPWRHYPDLKVWGFQKVATEINGQFGVYDDHMTFRGRKSANRQ